MSLSVSDSFDSVSLILSLHGVFVALPELSAASFIAASGGYSLVELHGLLTGVASLVAAHGGYSSLQCAGFSLQWLLWLQPQAVGGHTDSVIAALRL